MGGWEKIGGEEPECRICLWCPPIGSSSVCPALGSAQEVGSTTFTVRTLVWTEVYLSQESSKEPGLEELLSGCLL